ncbi:hypothetical protein AB1Y20_017546 [Prymnesium parvum]|uniref:PPM-type phosphatase domain-containing protein n=1 Tax=Prymnesium parvum TaxID=97485 RepID=A0AB34JKU9_PRYPA
MDESKARKKEEAALKKAEAQAANQKKREEALARKNAEEQAERLAVQLGMGTASLKGDRGNQEDRVVASRLSQGDRCCAVFDGHYGEQCAEYCHAQLLVQLQRSPYWFAFNDKAALKAAFAQTHAQFLKESNSQSGTTATVVLIRGRTLQVASVGNSRAVIFSDGKASQLTKDGERSEVPPPGLISTIPETAERILTQGDEFVLLASDGVWDVLSNEKACNIVRQTLAANPASPNPSEAARALCKAALQAESTDNICVSGGDVLLLEATWGTMYEVRVPEGLTPGSLFEADLRN